MANTFYKYRKQKESNREFIMDILKFGKLCLLVCFISYVTGYLFRLLGV